MKNEKLERCLKRKRLRNNALKRAILEVIEESDRALKVEEIQQRLREYPVRKPAINTIYRTLQILVDCDVISAINVGQTRYFTKHGASYFVCRECNRLISGPNLPEEVKRKIAKWFETDDAFEMVIYNLCKRCK